MSVLSGFLLPGVATAANDGLDRSFSRDGRVITPVEGGGGASDVAVQRDGKIVAMGSGDSSSGEDVGLIRYNRDGSLDRSFSGDGRATAGFPNSPDTRSDLEKLFDRLRGRKPPDRETDEIAVAVALQRDGKIVVAAIVYPQEPEYDSDFGVMRFLSNGQLDRSFSGDGRVTTSFPEQAEAHDVAVQPNGRIVVVGNSSHGNERRFAVARYKPNGSPDRSFSGDGKLSLDLNPKRQERFGAGGEARAVALQGKGKIVLAGTKSHHSGSGLRRRDFFKFAVLRFRSDGRLDRSFSRNGWATTGFRGRETQAYAVATLAGGRIVAGGVTWVGTSSSIFALASYHGDGRRDRSFSGDGKLTTNLPDSGEYVRDLTAQPRGRVLAVGSTHSHRRDLDLVRYRRDGRLDSSFSGDGVRTTTFEGKVYAHALARQRGGKVVVAGQANRGRDREQRSAGYAVARYVRDR